MSLPSRVELDEATAERLRKLRSLPVDMTHLHAAVQREIPRSQPGFFQRHLTLVRAVAASVVLGTVVVLLVLSLGSNAVLASPERLAAIHRDSITMAAHAQAVDSISEAQAVLHRDWPTAPALPSMDAEHQVMSCCVHMLGRKRIACVRLQVDGHDVSITVAPANDVRLPDGPTVLIDGERFTVQSHDGLNMLMGRQGDRFLCLISSLPADRLQQVVADLRR